MSLGLEDVSGVKRILWGSEEVSVVKRIYLGLRYLSS